MPDDVKFLNKLILGQQTEFWNCRPPTWGSGLKQKSNDILLVHECVVSDLMFQRQVPKGFIVIL